MLATEPKYTHIVYDHNGNKLPSRYDYKQTFKYPFKLKDDATDIPNFEAKGDVAILNNAVRLTNDMPNQNGVIWTKNANPHKEWQAVVGFRIEGHGNTGGEGLTFWYRKEKALGDVFGTADEWNGLGIFLDSFDDDHKKNNPLIYGILNDGTKKYQKELDGGSQIMGSCFKDFRNSPLPYWLKITYASRTLTVESAKHGDFYEVCFEAEIDLPEGYFFGVSASTGPEFADQHEVLMFEIYELNSLEKADVSPEVNEKEEQIFEDFKLQFDRLKEKKDYENLGKKVTDEEIYYLLTNLEENQHSIMEKIGLSHTNTNSAHSAQLETIEKRLSRIEDSMKLILEVIQKSGSVHGEKLLDSIETLHANVNHKLQSLEASNKQNKENQEKMHSFINNQNQSSSSGYSPFTVASGVVGFQLIIFICYQAFKKSREDSASKKFV
ncbi:Concanavalin A-like lectin/glucanase, subgroup domain-containing protein [Rozella allomycis CSF55]|uniref:Concanavalin A-like lectin/glucanase, subgroup domain-containing protein n=1 Tax=Rozella allomycis (strain CSF55) TaxID=988480 RepID=A0A075B132_ROZAC|nr:Concanavalin A-like lectin/glucanase, subgroup domain-containing protein [Rozella allomycis CSF55]|eukprot:EPZ34536.1 Concanavalin A-like lectin/glucanase, subgroup domain-containing protein [Rozella allomycis CSF55]